MPSEQALHFANRVWSDPSLALKVLDEDITVAFANVIDDIIFAYESQFQRQLLDIIVAAMNDAAVKGELSQFKLSFTPRSMTEKQHVRIIVIPELMDCERQPSQPSEGHNASSPG